MRTIDIRPRSFALGYALAVLLASLAVCSGCTGTGSPCQTDDYGCPTGWACVRGKCEKLEVR